MTTNDTSRGNVKKYSPSMNLLKNFHVCKLNYLDFLKKFDKNEWSPSYLEVFLKVMSESDRLVREKNFNTIEIAAVFEILFSCFQYLAYYPTIEKNIFLEYFRESLLLYTVDDLPGCLRIFNAIQGFTVAQIFHEVVVVNFESIKDELNLGVVPEI